MFRRSTALPTELKASCNYTEKKNAFQKTEQFSTHNGTPTSKSLPTVIVSPSSSTYLMANCCRPCNAKVCWICSTKVANLIDGSTVRRRVSPFKENLMVVLWAAGKKKKRFERKTEKKENGKDDERQCNCCWQLVAYILDSKVEREKMFGFSEKKCRFFYC